MRQAGGRGSGPFRPAILVRGLHCYPNPYHPLLWRYRSVSHLTLCRGMQHSFCTPRSLSVGVHNLCRRSRVQNVHSCTHWHDNTDTALVTTISETYQHACVGIRVNRMFDIRALIDRSQSRFHRIVTQLQALPIDPRYLTLFLPSLRREARNI